jgi:hypothetical protein
MRQDSSFYHRFFHIPIGRAPSLCYPDDRCFGNGVFGGAATTLLVIPACIALFGLQFTPYSLLALLVLPFGIVLWRLADRFETVERRARARRRRHECICCGVKLVDPSALWCSLCSAETPPDDSARALT